MAKKITMFLDTPNEIELSKANGYDVILPIQINNRLNEQLDDAFFEMYSTREAPIEPFTKCKIEIDNNIYYYYAYSTSIKTNFKRNTYKHSVYLIEPTKWLERHILGGRAFSSGSSFFTTNKELIELILKTCYVKSAVNSDIDIFANITLETNNRVEFNNEAREYFFPEQTTLFEALEAIGKSMNAFPRMKDFNTLTYDFFDETEVYTIIENNIFDKQSIKTIDNYCGSIDSVAINSIDKDIVHYFPNRANGISERSETITITENTQEVITDEKIYDIKKMTIKANPIRPTTVRVSTGGSEIDYDIENDLDITEYVFEKSQWDLLNENINGDPEKNTKTSAIYFNKNDRVISGLYNYNKFFFGFIPNQEAIFNIITLALRDIGELGEGKVIGLTDDRFEFNIQYLPLEDLKIRTYKDKWEDFEPNNTLIYNQGANIIDLNYYGQNLQATIKKLGNEQVAISFTTTDISNLKCGLKVGDYQISEISIDALNKFYKVKLTLDKNFNKLAEQVGIDSQLRLFDIPNDDYVVDRIIHKDYFVFLGTQKETVATTFYDIFKKRISGTLTRKNAYFNDNQIEIAREAVRQTTLPIINHTIPKAIILSWRNEDNNIEAYYRELGATMSKDKRKGVAYGDSKGELEFVYYTIYDQLPYQANDSARNTFPYQQSVSGANPLFNLTINNLYKDARERLKFILQLNFLSEDKDILIGDAFTKYNGLISRGAFDDFGTFVIPLTEKKSHTFQKSDLTNARIIDDNGQALGFSITYDETNLKWDITIDSTWSQTYTGWAIVKITGEVLLVCNNLNIDKIYTNFRQNYK